MIKARIRWCTCRLENILTLGKLLSLWFCFFLNSILFLIFQTSYRTYKIISIYELARPVMGTIFLVIIYLKYQPSCGNNVRGGIYLIIIYRICQSIRCTYTSVEKILISFFNGV